MPFEVFNPLNSSFHAIGIFVDNLFGATYERLLASGCNFTKSNIFPWSPVVFILYNGILNGTKSRKSSLIKNNVSFHASKFCVKKSLGEATERTSFSLERMTYVI